VLKIGLTQKEEHRLTVFENWMPRRIFDLTKVRGRDV